MKRGILTAAFLMASAGFASADYVIIVANIGTSQELKTTNLAGMPGMGRGMSGGPAMPGMPGMPSMPGMPGMPGGGSGMSPRPGGQQGMGMSGMRPPGMGMSGGGGQGGMQPPGSGNQGGSRPGMQMGMSGGGMPGPGMPGMPGMPGGGMPGGMMGMRGGMMMGMRGGMMMGMRGGMMPGGSMPGGMMGMMGLDSEDADDIPDYVIAVAEVKPPNKNMVKNLLQRGIVSVKLPERLGRSCQLLPNPSFGKIYVILEDNKPLPAVSVRFEEKFNNAVKEKASATDFLSVAEWALEHGLVDKFPAVMDKVVEGDKGNPAAAAYLKVKAELERKATDDPSIASWRDRLLNGYKVTETPHYLIVHNSANDTAVEITTHAAHLENAFRGFYYWFALKGIALPVPQTRQVVVLTNKESDFEQLRKILTSGPIVVDGFYARRESLGVMHAQRQDDPYKALRTYWENWSGKGYKRDEILQGNNQGMPKNGVPINAKLGGDEGRRQIAEAQMLALMLKALEQEAELATVSHEASRQLLFASGLLPRNVAVPEWLLFGMGSFFETPLQSPWPTIGAPSPYYLPRWRELKAKESGKGGLEKTAVATLRKVVSDGYFRSLPADGKPGEPAHYVYESALRKARTASWSLAYFLAQKHLDGLRQYFAELSKMPRDIELDDAVLLGCFARAFGCVDANNKADEAKLKALATEWYGYWQSVHFESEQTMKDIRETIAKEVKEAQKKAQQQEQSANQSGNGMFGGFPAPGMGPGVFPPGGMNPPAAPGVPQPGGPQQGGGSRPGAPPQGGSRPGGPPQGGAGQGGRVPPNGQPPGGAPNSPRQQ